MNGAPDEKYFEWLYTKIGTKNKNPARSYWLLAEQLHKKEFLWSVPNDDNRVLDGIELRVEFVDAFGIEEVDQEWMDLGCSMLEMLIALSRRASFESSGEPDEWFWKLLENLELHRVSDDLYQSYQDVAWEEVNEACDRVIYRTYERNGVGGLFPLRDAMQDQRRVELRYQMAAYLLEGDRVDNGPR